MTAKELATAGCSKQIELICMDSLQTVNQDIHSTQGNLSILYYYEIPSEIRHEVRFDQGKIIVIHSTDSNNNDGVVYAIVLPVLTPEHSIFTRHNNQKELSFADQLYHREYIFNMEKRIINLTKTHATNVLAHIKGFHYSLTYDNDTEYGQSKTTRHGNLKLEIVENHARVYKSALYGLTEKFISDANCIVYGEDLAKILVTFGSDNDDANNALTFVTGLIHNQTVINKTTCVIRQCK